MTEQEVQREEKILGPEPQPQVLDAVVDTTNALALRTADPDKIRQELALVHPDEINVAKVADEDPALTALAEKQVQALLTFKEGDFKARERGRVAVENMGRQLQVSAAQQSKMLDAPVRKLVQLGGEGGQVAKDLVQLTMHIQQNDPNSWSFGPGFFGRLLNRTPVIGEKIQAYFMQFEEARSIIDQIVNSLRAGAQQLERDNIIMSDDQIKMRELTYKLEKLSKLGRILDAKLEAACNTYPAGSEMSNYIKEELLFTLRQRIIDIQQQLIVNQQGVVSIEILKRNNIELVRGVNRTVDVTVSALSVAMVVAIGLANQGVVMEKVKMVREVGSNLILKTAQKLHEQGVEIHKQATEPQLELAKLQDSWHHISSALQELSAYRQEAIGQMAQTIIDLDHMTTEADTAIQKMEKGNRMRTGVALELES